jgi:N-carbamoyl-L-amino-acid hydrolase
LRQDAVFAFAELLVRLDEHWQVLNGQGIDLVITSGMVSTDPGNHSVSRIPGKVSFSLELRSQSIDTLESVYRLALAEARRLENSRRVKFEFDEHVISLPAKVDSTWAERLKECCQSLGITHVDIASGAGHDAAVFANEGIPTAMIFIRNEHGSHNPHESMDLDDFMMGTEVLYRAIATDWSAVASAQDNLPLLNTATALPRRPQGGFG